MQTYWHLIRKIPTSKKLKLGLSDLNRVTELCLPQIKNIGKSIDFEIGLEKTLKIVRRFNVQMKFVDREIKTLKKIRWSRARP